MAAGIFTLSLDLRDLDVGVAYTIWTGIGSVGVVLLGALIFHEKLTVTKVVCFTAIIAGVIGLQLVGGG
jgi:quaternary ammonium compound-resistance protein SugE